MNDKTYKNSLCINHYYMLETTLKVEDCRIFTAPKYDVKNTRHTKK